MSDYSTDMIKQIQIPQGWESLADSEHSSIHFFPHEFPNVRFAIFQRHVSLLNHLALCRILTLGERVLSKQELDVVAPVLGNMSDPDVFEVKIAMVLELRGRRVLVIEGLYQSNGHRCRSIFVESSSNSFEQIYYQAPGYVFERFEGAADTAFKSILWRH